MATSYNDTMLTINGVTNAGTHVKLIEIEGKTGNVVYDCNVVTEMVSKDVPNETDKEQKVTLPAVKRITQIKDLIDGYVYSMFVENYDNGTCKLVLTKYSKFPISIHYQVWSSEILTTECDAYSIELQSDNSVKIYGSRSGYKEAKTFHWDRSGVLISISD